MNHTNHTKRKLFQKVLSILLSVTLVLSLMPSSGLTISADETAQTANGSDTWDGTVAGSWAGGSGTETDPYQISTGAQLAYLATSVNSGNEYNGTYFVLTNDIDLNNQDWTPIGTSNSGYFCGVFDGAEHTISNLYINSTSSYQGLFGYLGGTVKNLTVSGEVTGAGDVGGIVGCNYSTGAIVENCINQCTVTGTGTSIGGVVGNNGYAERYGTIKDCTNSGTIIGEGYYVGGVVGRSGTAVEGCTNSGTVTNTESYTGGIVGRGYDGVTNCTNSGTVTTTDGYTGGIVGFNTTGNIENCINEETVTGGSIIGGIAGYTGSGVVVTGCTNSGTVENSAATTGGIVAANYGTVEKCLNSGNINGKSHTGGVVGYNYGDAIQNSANNGIVIGKGNVGGVVGNVDSSSGSIVSSYNTGAVSGESYVGGILGTTNDTGDTVSNCYYLSGSASSGIGSGSGEATAKTAEEFASGEVCYLLNAGVYDGTQVWYQNLDNGEPLDAIPVLDAHGTVYRVSKAGEASYSNTQGTGTEHYHSYDENGFCTGSGCGAYEPATDSDGDGYYEIDNAGKLFWFAALVNGVTSISGTGTEDVELSRITAAEPEANAVLTADIDLSVTTDTHTDTQWTPIGDYFANTSLVYSGIFDGCGYTISGLNVSTTDDYQGLFGYVSGGTVKQVAVSGSVVGGDYTGGVAGYNGGTVTECCSTVTVCGSDYTGGVIGYNDGIITDCCSDVVETGESNVGGVVGYNDGEVSNSYNVGAVRGSSNVGGVAGSNVGTVTNCYFLSVTVDAAIGSDMGTTDRVDVKTADEFGSGEVTWFLNGGVMSDDGSVATEATTDGTQVWYQNLDSSGTVDTYPVFSGETVYIQVSGYLCDKTTKVYSGYSNTEQTEADLESLPVADHVLDDDGNCTVCGLISVASVTIDGTTTYYFDIQDAVTAAKGYTATIRLLADVDLGESSIGYISFSSGTIELDFNGYTLSGEDNTVIYCYGSADVTLTGDGTVINKGSSTDTKAVYITGSSSFTMESGTIKGWSAIASGGGTITINGGSLISTDNAVIYTNMQSATEIDINGGTFTSADEYTFRIFEYDSISVKGGTFIGQVYVEMDSNEAKGDYPLSEYIANGYGLKDESGSWVTYNSDDTKISQTVTVTRAPLQFAENGDLSASLNTNYGETNELTIDVEKTEIADTGSAITYQWYVDDEAVVEATDSSYDLSGLGTGCHTVYCYATCEGYTLGSAKCVVTVSCAHALYDDYGFCEVCGAYEPATDEDSDGIYEIGNAGQLFWFAALVNGTTSITSTINGTEMTAELEGITEAVAEVDAILTNDIDLSVTTDTHTSSEWIPIGECSSNYLIVYNGTFDGFDYTISGLSINNCSNDYRGLFGLIEADGVIQNLTVSGSVDGTGGYLIGGLVGWNCGSIINCISSVTVSDDLYDGGIAGGIAGGNEGSISNCSNEGKITSYGVGGGVVGWNYYGSLSNCSNSSAVSASGEGSLAGGIAGLNEQAVIAYSTNSGAVSASGTGSYAGGIAGGSDFASVGYNVNSGAVDASGDGCYAGGVVGLSFLDVVTDCSNEGIVTAAGESSNAGGILALSCAQLSNCYNVGAVSGSVTGGVVADTSIPDGITAEEIYNYYGITVSVINCYYLDTTASCGIGSDTTDMTSAVAKTEAEFASGEVAWLLQSGQETAGEIVWGQDLSGLTSSTSDDSYPVLTSSEELQVVKVDFILSTNGASTGTVLGDAQYTNTNQNVSSYPTYESAYSTGSAYYLDEACTSAAAIDPENASYAGDTTVYVKETMLAKLYSRTLTLDGSIGVNYYVDLSGVEEDDRSNYTVVFTVDGVDSEAEYDPESWRDDFDSEGTKYYRFTGYVTSVQMASEITVQLVYHYDNEETQVVGTDTYSVMDYCEKSISNGWSSKDLCEALLNYGGYAQTYFAEDEGTDGDSSDASGDSSTEGSTEDGSEGSTGETLANAYLSTWDSSWSDPVAEWSDIPSDLASHSSSIDGTLPDEIASSSTSGDGSSGESAVYFSVTLLMQSQTVIRLYFNLADEADKDAVTFTVDGTELEIYNTTAGNTCYGDFDYYVEFKVPANKLSTPYEITVSNTSGQEATVTYSALTYVNNKLGTNGTDDEDLRNLCIALYYYSQAADTYEDWYAGNN